VYVYNGVLFAIKKNETMWFEDKWMPLKDIMLSEESQAHKEKVCMFFLMYVR
jgi:hypothetical protein